MNDFLLILSLIIWILPAQEKVLSKQSVSSSVLQTDHRKVKGGEKSKEGKSQWRGKNGLHLSENWQEDHNKSEKHGVFKEQWDIRLGSIAGDHRCQIFLTELIFYGV